MQTGFKSHPFWDYSLEVYQRDGVSSALIKFQDRHGLDVNSWVPLRDSVGRVFVTPLRDAHTGSGLTKSQRLTLDRPKDHPPLPTHPYAYYARYSP